MPYCRNCGALVTGDAPCCGACSAPAPPDAPSATQIAAPLKSQPSLGGRRIIGCLVALVGGVLLAVGPFLAWISAEALGRYEWRTGIYWTDYQVIAIVVVGIVGAAFAAASPILRHRRLNWMFVVAGAICLGFIIFFWIHPSNDYGFSALGIRAKVRETQAGLYLCLVGSLLLLVGGFVAALRGKGVERG